MHTFDQKPHPAMPAKVTTNVADRRALRRSSENEPILHTQDQMDVPTAPETKQDSPLDFRRVPIHPREEGPCSQGVPLASGVRARLETILGTPLSDIRIHHGPAAERATSAVGVPAFTVGQSIFLSAAATEATRHLDHNRSGRANAAGERLLAHEAAHTVQQSGASLPPHASLHATPLHPLLQKFGVNLPRTTYGSREEREADAAARGLQRPTTGSPFAIAAAPPDALAFPPIRRFKDIWPEFDQASGGFNPARTKELAEELAQAPYDIDDPLNHGIEVVKWLQEHGEPKLAANLLKEVRDAWLIRFVTEKSKLPVRGAVKWAGDDPNELIKLGKQSARDGKHAEAFQFFGVANEILSYYALEASQMRQEALNQESVDDAATAARGNDPARDAIREAVKFPRMIGRTLQYGNLQDIYDRMREIYGFYYVLEQEALAAGDAKAAADARTKSAELHQEIKDKYTWGQMPQTTAMGQDVLEPAEIAEVGYTSTQKGPGLTLYGANNAETDLTPLPGLPSPKEVGNNVQVQNLATLQNALAAQTDFQAEIGRVPEIQSAFHSQPIDLNDTAKRQKVWQIMYGVFKQSGAGALGSLMALMGRYQKAFTIHTTYNVRDWGTSYLDSTLPTDLTGRAEKDCGVYALTVAWDVYQTVKHADGKLEVKFELATMLEHVMLIITDVAAGEHYVVNNDQISPPEKGDPLKQVAPGYAAIRGLPHTVGPTVPIDLGSTKDSEKKFHDQAWTQYTAGVDWGLQLSIPPDVAALEKTDPAAYAQKIKAIEKDRYESFYHDQELFDRGANALGPQVDGLGASAGNATALAAKLGPLVDTAGALAGLFYKLALHPGVAFGSTHPQAKLPSSADYVFSMPQGSTVHPITRVARAILHLKALNGTTTPKMDALVQFCDQIPVFKQDLDAYRAAGANGAF